jgi:beta-glucanase (GH16 family)
MWARGIRSAGVAVIILATALVIGNGSTRGYSAEAAANGASAKVVAACGRPEGGGWTAQANGVVAGFGGAPFYGDAAGFSLTRPIVGMATTADGAGYWLVASDGGVFAFGDAAFYGSTGSIHLNKPIVGMAATSDGRGYWLVASDGGVFAFGDAAFYGSTGSIHLNETTVVSLVPSGDGYFIVSDEGDWAPFGSMATGPPSAPSSSPPADGDPIISTTRASTTTTTTQPSSNEPLGVPGQWSLKFSDSLSGSSLDESKWATCYPWFTPCDQGTNFGNTELEWYLPSQVSVTPEGLALTAEQTPTEGYLAGASGAGHGAAAVYPWRSGMVTTYNSFNFTYGFVQVVARVPKGAGFWPTLWLLPSNKSWPPEIDIMEVWGNDTSQLAVTNIVSDVGGNRVQAHTLVNTSDLSADYHTYAVDWEPGKVTWYLDGQQVAMTTSGVSSQQMYFLANLAVDGQLGKGSNASTPSTGTFNIKSVDIWQH